MAEVRDVRLRKADLFHALGYKPHPGQLLVHRSTARYRVVACGTRFGKSTVGIFECVAALLEPRQQALGWVIAPTFELTRRIFDKVVEIIFQRFPHRLLSFDRRTHSVIVANLGGGRSELRARSADKPTGLLGESLDFLIVDEAAKLKDEVWNEHLAPRLIDRRGWGLLLSTPGGPGWFWRAYRRGQNGRDADYKSWSMPTTSNPHIPLDLIEAERHRLEPQLFQREYLAQFQGVENEPCDRCGGPKRDAIAVIVLKGAEQPLHCTECNKLVHMDGTTAVALWDGGKTHTMIVSIQSRGAKPNLPSFGDHHVMEILEGQEDDNPEELPPGVD